MTMNKRLAILVPLILSAQLAAAGEWWGSINLASKHIGEEKPLNERNPGIGIEYAQSREITYMAGVYRNSHDRTSVYGFAAYTPVQLGAFSLGVAGGAASGYPSGHGTRILPVAAGLVRWRGERVGANLLIIPKSKNAQVTFGAQVVFKF